MTGQQSDYKKYDCCNWYSRTLSLCINLPPTSVTLSQSLTDNVLWAANIDRCVWE